MAATTTELRKIYINLFQDPDDPSKLRGLQAALAAVEAGNPESRIECDRQLARLNGGKMPSLTFTQLDCLRSVLAAKAFQPLIPTAADAATSAHLLRFYKSLFAEPDLAHLRALQQAVFEYDQLGTESKRLAVLELLRDLDPEGPWNDSHIGALDALLVRDITFKQVAPFQVTGDCW